MSDHDLFWLLAHIISQPYPTLEWVQLWDAYMVQDPPDRATMDALAVKYGVETSEVTA